MNKGTILTILGGAFSMGSLVVGAIQAKQDKEELKEEILKELRTEEPKQAEEE